MASVNITGRSAGVPTTTLPSATWAFKVDSHHGSIDKADPACAPTRGSNEATLRPHAEERRSACAATRLEAWGACGSVRADLILRDARTQEHARSSGRGRNEDRAVCRRRGDRMKRREFMTLIGGAAATWPLAARAQQGERMRRIGVLMNAAEDVDQRANLAAFPQALQPLGWTEAATCRWRPDGPVAVRRRFADTRANWSRSHRMSSLQPAPRPWGS